MAGTYQEKELDNQPLLESKSQDRTQDTSIDSLDITQKPARRKRPQYLRWLSYFLAIAYIPLIILYVLLFLKLSTPKPEAECKNANLDIFPSLARSSAIQFEQRPFSVKIHHNPFAGDPRPELDNAWHDLFEGSPSTKYPNQQTPSNKARRYTNPRLKRRPRLLQPHIHPIRRRFGLCGGAGRAPRTALPEKDQALDLQRLLPHQRNRSRHDRMAPPHPYVFTFLLLSPSISPAPLPTQQTTASKCSANPSSATPTPASAPSNTSPATRPRSPPSQRATISACSGSR